MCCVIINLYNIIYINAIRSQDDDSENTDRGMFTDQFTGILIKVVLFMIISVVMMRRRNWDNDEKNGDFEEQEEVNDVMVNHHSGILHRHPCRDEGYATVEWRSKVPGGTHPNLCNPKV